MTVFQAIVLGAVQGITEFLPVSSSGHLILVPSLFGWPVQNVAFDATIHLATLAATVFALREDVTRVAKGIVSGDAFGRVGRFILLVTVPVLVVGFLLRDAIDSFLRQTWIVALALAVWGVLLWVADRNVRANPTDDVRRLSWKQVLCVGLSEILALVPGTSRSGVTMTVGIFAGLDRATAARLSFLLGIPAIAAAGLFGVFEVASGAVELDLLPLAAGFATAFATGFAAIRFLLRFLRQGTLWPFALYRIALAFVVLWLV